MIEVARAIDSDARALRKFPTNKMKSNNRRTAIARAANALLGTGGSRYPDATGTLRLSFGTVKGYEEDGQAVPASTFAGLYDRAKDMKERPPLDLPERWEPVARG